MIQRYTIVTDIIIIICSPGLLYFLSLTTSYSALTGVLCNSLMHFPAVHWDQTMIIVCQSLGSRPTQVQEVLTLLPRLFGATCCCLSVQPFQLLPLRNIWRHISLTWPFPHRHRHAWWAVDVTELFPRFCCWTLIWLSRHWPWLRRAYWHYRSLIDWLMHLIDQTFALCDAFCALWSHAVFQLWFILTFHRKQNSSQCKHMSVG